MTFQCLKVCIPTDSGIRLKWFKDDSLVKNSYYEPSCSQFCLELRVRKTRQKVWHHLNELVIHFIVLVYIAQLTDF